MVCWEYMRRWVGIAERHNSRKVRAGKRAYGKERRDRTARCLKSVPAVIATMLINKFEAKLVGRINDTEFIALFLRVADSVVSLIPGPVFYSLCDVSSISRPVSRGLGRIYRVLLSISWSYRIDRS